MLAKAKRVVVASNQLLAVGGVSYDYANQIILGLARIRAQQWETEVVALAVWDGAEGDGPGGTSSAVQRWQALGLPVEIISLPAPARALPARRRKLVSRKSPLRARAASKIMAMLFADAVSFSKLQERDVHCGRHEHDRMDGGWRGYELRAQRGGRSERECAGAVQGRSDGQAAQPGEDFQEHDDRQCADVEVARARGLTNKG